MLGFGYEEQNAGRKSRKNKIDTLSSILGFIINIRREVMEQRELIEILWEGIQSGQINPFGKVIPQKRSLAVSQEEQEVLYTADSTDDEKPMKKKASQGKGKKSDKRRKSSNF
jgi:hypothetical protein